MSEQLLQTAWQQARQLKPVLSPDVSIVERSYRGQCWFVLQRQGSRKLHRINPLGREILIRCNGDLSLEKILLACQSVEQARDLNEVELLKVINQLIDEGLLIVGDQFPCAQLAGSSHWLSRFKNPLMIRLPLWNPDRLLKETTPYLSRWLGPLALSLWCLLVFTALFQTFSHWHSITENMVDVVLRPDNLLWLWLLYPISKILHEAGHAYAVSLQGGVVPEVGIVFMFGVPLPYVDASAATLFPNKVQRMIVDGAGIMVELLIASLALFVWLSVDTGLVSQLAYNLMVLCSVSTLFFNANPLMRFDGYYFLSDYLEIPNLSARSSLYWRYLFKHHVFGLADERFNASHRERYWFSIYGALSFCYRIFIYCAIIFIAAQQFLLLGLAVACWLAYQQLFKPVLSLLQFLLGTRLGEQRRRAVVCVAVIVSAMLLFVFLVPMPVSRTANAIVWLPDDANIRAGTAGTVMVVHTADGQLVRPRQALITLSDPFLLADRDIALAEHAELEAKYSAARIDNLVDAAQLEDELQSSMERLARFEQRLDSLVLSSDTEGVFYTAPDTSSLGRFVEQGELLGFVLEQHQSLLRVMVDQDDIALVDGHTQSIEVQLSTQPGHSYLAQRLGGFPSASKQLPSPALGTLYGGAIAIDPVDESGQKALESWFQLEVRVLHEPGDVWPGSRALVRFSLDKETLAEQFYREFRQLFMKKLSI